MNQVLKFVLIIALISIGNAVSQKITAIDLPTKDLRKVRRQSPIDFREISLDCRDGMTVTIRFAGTFSGVIYSRDHFDNRNCRYVENESKDYYTFTIPFTDECGTKPPCQLCSTLENVIIIQSDPQVLTSNDLARKLSCPIPNDYKKDVFFKPIDVNSLEVINVPSEEGNIQCWMNITEGIYPNVKEISRNINIGDTLSIIFHLNDPGKRRQLQIKQCWAYDNDDFDSKSTKKKILTDKNGCPIVDSIGYWKRETNLNRIDATFIAYTTLKAFKFPGSNKVHIKCNIEFCTDNCFDPCSETQNNYCLQNPYDSRCQEQFITSTTERYRTENKYSTKQRVFTQRPIEYKTTSQPIYFGTTKNNIENIDCDRYPYNPACEDYNLNDFSKLTTQVSKVTTLRPFYTKTQNELDNFNDCKINPYSPECLNCKQNPNRKECKLSTERFGTYSTIKNIQTNKKYYTSTPSTIQTYQEQESICDLYPNSPDCITNKNIEKTTPRLISVTTSGIINCEINPYAAGCEISKLSTRRPYNCITNPNLPQCRKSTRLPLKPTQIDCNRTPYLPECNTRSAVTKTSLRPTDVSNIISTAKPYYSQSQTSLNCNLNPYAPGCLKVSTIPSTTIRTLDCINNPNNVECEGYNYDKPNIESYCILYPDSPKCLQEVKSIDCNRNPNDYRCKQNIFRPTTSKSVSIQSTYSKIDCNRTPFIPQCLKYVDNKPVYETNDEKDTLNCKLNPYTEKCQGRIGISFNCDLYPNSPRCKSQQSTKSTDCLLNPNSRDCIGYNYNKITTDQNNIDITDCRINPNQQKCNLYSTRKQIQTSTTSSEFEYQSICDRYPNKPECNEYKISTPFSTSKPYNIDECTRNPNLPQCQIQTSTLKSTYYTSSTSRGTDCLQNPYLPECSTKTRPSYNCNISPNAPGCKKDKFAYSKRPIDYEFTKTVFPETTTLRSYYSTTTPIQLNCDKNPYATGCGFKTTDRSFNCIEYPNSPGCSIQTTQIPIIDCSKDPNAKECSGYIYDKPKSPLKPFNFVDCNKYPNEPECITKTTSYSKVTSRPFSETLDCRKNPYATNCLVSTTQRPSQTPTYGQSTIQRTECDINPYRPECIGNSYSKSTVRPQSNILTNKPYSINPSTSLRTTTLRTYYSQSTPARLNCNQNPYSPECISSTKNSPINCRNNPNAPECVKSTLYQSTTRTPSRISNTKQSSSTKTFTIPENTTFKPISSSRLDCNRNPYAAECIFPTTRKEVDCRVNPNAPGCYKSTNAQISTVKYSPTQTLRPFSEQNCDINPNAVGCARIDTTRFTSDRPTYKSSSPINTSCKFNPYSPECSGYNYNKPISTPKSYERIDCNRNPYSPQCSSKSTTSQFVTRPPINLSSSVSTTKRPSFSPSSFTNVDCLRNPNAFECISSTKSSYNCQNNPNAPGCFRTTTIGAITKRPLYEKSTYSQINCYENPSHPECNKYDYKKPISTYPDCNLYPNIPECQKRITKYQPVTKKPITFETIRPSSKTIPYFSPEVTTSKSYYTSATATRLDCTKNPFAIGCRTKATTRPYNCKDYPNSPECSLQTTRITNRPPPTIDCSKNPYAKECDGYIYEKPTSGYSNCILYPNAPECRKQITKYSPVTSRPFGTSTTQQYFSPEITTTRPYYSSVTSVQLDCNKNPYAIGCSTPTSQRPYNCREYPNSPECFSQTSRITTQSSKIDCSRNPFSKECSKYNYEKPIQRYPDCNLYPNSPECKSKISTYAYATKKPIGIKTTPEPSKAIQYFSPKTTTLRPYNPSVVPTQFNCNQNPYAVGCLEKTTRKPYNCAEYPNDPRCSSQKSIDCNTNPYAKECEGYNYKQPLNAFPDCNKYPNKPECIRKISTKPTNLISTQQPRITQYYSNPKTTTFRPYLTQVSTKKFDCNRNPYAPECQQQSTRKTLDCNQYPNSIGCPKSTFIPSTTITSTYSDKYSKNIDCSKNPYLPECLGNEYRKETPRPFTLKDCNAYPNSPECLLKKPSTYLPRPSITISSTQQPFTSPGSFSTRQQTSSRPYYSTKNAPEVFSKPYDCKQYPNSPGCYTPKNIQFTTKKPIYLDTKSKKTNCDSNPFNPECIGYSKTDCTLFPNSEGCSTRQEFQAFSTQKPFSLSTLPRDKLDCRKTPFAVGCSTTRYDCSNNPSAPGCYKLSSSTIGPEYKNTGSTRIDCSRNPFSSDCRTYLPPASKSITSNYSPSTSTGINCSLNPNSPLCSKPYYNTNKPLSKSQEVTNRKDFISSTKSSISCDDYPNSPECIRSISPVYSSTYNPKYSITGAKEYSSTLKPYEQSDECSRNPNSPNCRRTTLKTDCNRYPYNQECIQYTTSRTYLPPISTTLKDFYQKTTINPIDCDRNPYQAGCKQYSNKPSGFTTNTIRSFNCDLYPNSPECTKLSTNKQVNCQNTPYLPECLKYEQKNRCAQNPNQPDCNEFTTQKTFYSQSSSKYNSCALYPNSPGCSGSVTTAKSYTNRIINCDKNPNLLECLKPTTKRPFYSPSTSKASNCKLYPFSPECSKATSNNLINCNETPYLPGCTKSTIVKPFENSNIYPSQGITQKPINCNLYPDSEECLQVTINSSPIYIKTTTDRYSCNINPLGPGCSRIDFTTQSPRPFKTVTRPLTSSKSNTYLPKSSTPQSFTGSYSTSDSKNKCELFPYSSECQGRTPSTIKDFYTSTPTSIPYCARYPEDKKCLACYPGSPDPDCPQPFRPAITKVPSTYLPPFK